jgi:hypothetical protein
MPAALMDAGRARALQVHRTFSGYLAALVESDLERSRNSDTQRQREEEDEHTANNGSVPADATGAH